MNRPPSINNAKAPAGLSMVQIGRIRAGVEILQKLKNPLASTLADRIAGARTDVMLRELMSFWRWCYQLVLIFQMAAASERPVSDFRDELEQLFPEVDR